jgi:hypothetical protein
MPCTRWENRNIPSLHFDSRPPGPPSISGGFDGKENTESKSYIVADSEITYQCSMKEKNTGARRKARIKVSMENVYTDEYPDGIITCLYFTNVDQQNENLTPVSE